MAIAQTDRSKQTSQRKGPRIPQRVMQGFFVAAVCTLLVFVACLWQSYRFTVMAQKQVAAEDSQHTQTASKDLAAPSPIDLEKAVDAAVDASIKRDEALLDKMLLLVGGYSVILGVLALGTVFVSRQEAQAQLKTVKDELASKGLVFNQPDVAPFRDKLRSAGFYNEWKGKYGEQAWALLEKAVGKLS